MKVCTDAARANWPVFFARPNAQGLRRFVQVVRSGGGVYRGTGFKLQRCEALFGLCLHKFWAKKKHHAGAEKWAKKNRS